MSTRQALSTVAVVSFLVLSGLTAGVTGTVAAGNASGNTVFADHPVAYQSGAGESDTTVTEGESVTVDVPVTDGTIAPDTALGEKWTHSEAPETVAGNAQAWTSEHAIGDRFIEGHVYLAEQRTVDNITIETGGNISNLVIYPVGSDTVESVNVTDGTATLSTSDVTTDQIVVFEQDDETTEPLSIVDVRASNDGSEIDRTDWTTEFSTMKSIDVSEALDGDDEPWRSPTAMSDREYALTKIFSEEKRIDSLTVEHDGQNYPSDITVTILSSGGGNLTKTVSSTGQKTTIDFEAIDAKTVVVAEDDNESSNSWAVTGLRYHKASSNTVESVRVDASALGAGTVNATRGGSGAYSVTFTPNYLSVPDGTYTLPVTATDAAGNEYVNETLPITVDTGAPQFASQPQASDQDGDGTVTNGETVTVTGDFDTTKATVEAVTAYHKNVSTGPEAADGDETPWTSEQTIDDRTYRVEVHFASEQTIDKIEIDTSGTTSPLVARAGYRSEQVSATGGTATMELNSPESASSFSFLETDQEGAGHWSISDLNAYHDGQQLEESQWSVETSAVKERNVTSTFEDESATWSARSSIGDNVVGLEVGLAERTTVDTLTIEHAGGTTPSQLAISSRDSRNPFLMSVDPSGSTTTVDLPTAETDTLFVWERGASTETDWAITDLTVSEVANDDVEQVTVDASLLGAGTVEAQAVGPRTYEATIEPASGVDGSYALDVTATDEAGNTETVKTDEITVQTSDSGSSTTDRGSTDDSPPSSDPPSSTDPDGSTTTGGGAVPFDTTNRPEMVVEAVTSNETTNVSITHARAGSNVTIERNGSTGTTANENAADETVALDAVHATVTNEGNYSVEITEDESPPPGAEQFDVSDSEPAIGYVQVDHSEAATFDDVTFEFRLSAAALGDRGIEPGDVVLYRYSDGSWTQLDTSVVYQDDTWVTYEADSPGFSTFAVGARSSPSISVTDAEVSAEEAAPGDQVIVEAAVENDGDAAGESTLELTLDGERAVTEEVSLDAGETTTVTFETSVAEAGQYDVAVDGTSAGTLSVGAETQSSTATQTVTEGTESDADGTGLVTIALAVLVLLLGAGVFRYVR